MKHSLILSCLLGLLSFFAKAQVAPLSQWVWMNGDIRTSSNFIGVYGTQGIPAVGNKPGSLERCVSWKDANGNFWLFGGLGCAGTLTIGSLNALWKYDPLINQWTWIKGDNTIDVFGVYGTQGVANPANKPGARYLSESWIDNNGKLWLFGGLGFGANGSAGRLNDLWKYDPLTNQWTWMKGDNTINVSGVYGTLGVANPANKPGARYGCGSWKDNSDNLWLFGGDAGFATNDLWKYDPSINQWTWVKGDNTGSIFGVYGIQGVAANTNKPGSRIYAGSWKDKTGNFWLFGAGVGFGGVGNNGALNDLWKYDPLTNQWTWLKGDTSANVHGIYGTAGIPSVSNKPGARGEMISLADTSGNLWLFGGDGYAGSSSAAFNLLNDLWKYDPLINEWTWLKGDSIINPTAAVYGSFRLASIYNKIPSRRSGGAWIDSTNTIWIFGGNANSDVNPDYYNDLWKLPPLQLFLASVNTDWENPLNWDRQTVPDSNAVIIVNSGTVTLNSSKLGGTVILGNNATLTINTNDTLKMFGYLKNLGHINGAGAIFITGDTSYLNTPGTIDVPITLSTKRLHLTGHSNTSSIIFTNGSTIRLDSFHLNMGTGALVRNSDNYIITNDTGRLIRNVAAAPVSFPVGVSYTSYTPVTISNTGTAGNLRVRVEAGVITNSRMQSGLSNVTQTNGYVNRTWLIDSTAAGSLLGITTQWNAADEQPDFDRTNCYIAQSHGCQPPPNCVDSYYDINARSAASGSDPYTQTRSDITSPTSFIVKSGADTSFFTGNAGNGLWDDPNNWTIGIVPPLTLGSGRIIVIDYTVGTECVVNGDLTIKPGAAVIVVGNKRLRVTGNVIVQ